MASVTMRVVGYYTVEVPDGTSEEVEERGHKKAQEADFGELHSIDWEFSSMEHDDGRILVAKEAPLFLE